MAGEQGANGAGSTALTVMVALGANIAIAVAKSAAAVVTGSASMVAESAHSWADAGNECFLLVGERRSRRGRDDDHPDGYGREAYVWSLFAAVGLFVAGAAVSITHGVHALLDPEPAEDFLVGYLVLGAAAILEGVSFLQSVRQARHEAFEADRDVLDHVLATSDPMLRAVFAEDAAALVGIVLAATGLLAHQITGSAVPDALGSIAIGIVLGVVAVILLDRNRRFLLGEAVDPQVSDAARRKLLEDQRIDRVGYLRIEYVGPRQVTIDADVDLAGEPKEREAALLLRDIETAVEAHPRVVRARLSITAER